MSRTRATPTKDELWCAHNAGVPLDRYVRFMKEYKQHSIAMELTRMDDELASMLKFSLQNVVTMLDARAAVEEQGVDLLAYLRLRYFCWNDLIIITHDQAIEAIKAGIRDYPRNIRTDFTHDQIMAFHEESTRDADSYFAVYCIARGWNASVEEATILSGIDSVPESVLIRMLESGVTVIEAIEVMQLVTQNPQANWEMYHYAIARLEKVPASHQEAIEVMRDCTWLGRYIQLRDEGLSHENALNASNELSVSVSSIIGSAD